jgi:hypothetical protein
MPMKICLVKGCGVKVYARHFCLKHYQHFRSGRTLDLIEPPPPARFKIASDKKRCRSRMSDGSQCVRPIKAAGMCSAHHKEAEDRRAFELREQPIVSDGFEYEGDEESLMRMCAQQEQVND